MTDKKHIFRNTIDGKQMFVVNDKKQTAEEWLALGVDGNFKVKLSRANEAISQARAEEREKVLTDEFRKSRPAFQKTIEKLIKENSYLTQQACEYTKQETAKKILELFDECTICPANNIPIFNMSKFKETVKARWVR
jgi:hypothetical protein